MNKLFFGIFFFCFAQTVIAAGSSITNGASSLNYSLDVSFVDIDSLAPPGQAKVSSNNPRSLGLRHIKVDLDWSFGTGSALHLGLRPDATLDRFPQDPAGTPAREFDSRAGTVDVPASRLYFLNSYRLEGSWEKDLELAFGVWEQLAFTRLPMEDLLNFGLLVLLPEKFSAARLRWRNGNESSPGGTPTRERLFDFYLMRGNGDRVEAWDQQSRTYDRAPTAGSPFIGGALQFFWAPTLRYALGVTLDYNQYAGTAKTAESHAELFFAYAEPKVLPRPVRLRGDLRYLYRQTPKLQTASSTELSALVDITDNISAFTAGHLGFAQKASSGNANKFLPVKGWQVDLGVQVSSRSALQLLALASLERRSMQDDAGHWVGAFRSANPRLDGTSMLRRFGLEVRFVY